MGWVLYFDLVISKYKKKYLASLICPAITCCSGGFEQSLKSVPDIDFMIGFAYK